MSARHTTVAVEHVMGTAVSIHLITEGVDQRVLDEAIAGCWAELHNLDRIFSPYLPGSEVSRIRRGELRLDDAHPLVREVARESSIAESTTHGLFSAHFNGAFDPTGYVKGWAVERAARLWLEPLLLLTGLVAAGINAGGDMQLFTAVDSDWLWRIGIADPADSTRIAATLAVANGAVATSGVSERGDHIVDPRTGLPARGVASATVVADSLTQADLWATAAVVAGDDLAWIAEAGVISGLLITDDGRTRRWAGPAELVAAATAY